MVFNDGTGSLMLEHALVGKLFQLFGTLLPLGRQPIEFGGRCRQRLFPLPAITE
jgi:hypothetical protein